MCFFLWFQPNAHKIKVMIQTLTRFEGYSSCSGMRNSGSTNEWEVGKLHVARRHI